MAACGGGKETAPTLAVTATPAMGSPTATPIPTIDYYDLTYSVSPYGKYTARVWYPSKATRPLPAIVTTDGDDNIGLACLTGLRRKLASSGYIGMCFITPNPNSIDETQWAAGFGGGIAILKNENINLNHLYTIGLIPANLASLAFLQEE